MLNMTLLNCTLFQKLIWRRLIYLTTIKFSMNKQLYIITRCKKTSEITACGDRRVWTDDLLLAEQALSQLSYIPNFTNNHLYKSRSLNCWWAYVELHHRPHPYQGCALTNWAIGPLKQLLTHAIVRYKSPPSAQKQKQLNNTRTNTPQNQTNWNIVNQEPTINTPF